MIKKILKTVRGFSTLELVIMVGFAALAAGALIYLGTTPKQTASTQPVNVNIKVEGATTADKESASGSAATTSESATATTTESRYESANAASELSQATIDDMRTVINSVNADYMLATMTDLGDTDGLAHNGRYAGENTDVEDYIVEAFRDVGIEPENVHKQPFDFLFTKTDSVTFNLFTQNDDGTFADALPLLPKLDESRFVNGHVDWNKNEWPFMSNLVDPNTRIKNLENWENRTPIAGVDYNIPFRAGPVDPGLSKVEIDYLSGSKKSITTSNPGGYLALYPAATTGDFSAIKNAQQHGAKGVISVSTVFIGTPLIPSMDYGWLTEGQSGEVITSSDGSGFVQMYVNKFLFDELANGVYFADITITAGTNDEDGNKAPYRYTKESGKINNVIAEIPADPNSPVKDEVVIVTSHLDGQGTQQGDPKTTGSASTRLAYPSIEDNASAVAVMMETARVLKANNILPKRTIRFISFNAEEEYYRGSDAYVKGLSAEERSKIVAAINLEGVGGQVSWSEFVDTVSLIDLKNYPRLWDIAFQAVNDAQLNNDICFPNGTSPSWTFDQKIARTGCDWTTVKILYWPVNSGSSINQYTTKIGFFIDLWAFKDYNIPGFNLSDSSNRTCPSCLSHNPYDNLYNLTNNTDSTGEIAWSKHMPLYAKFVAATAYELGMIPTLLKGQIQYVQ